MNSSKDKNKRLVAHLKTTGYIYFGSEIYGGVKNTWDYGPIGTLLLDNIIQCWKEEFILKTNSVLIKANTFLSELVWKASGHIDKFYDYMSDCKKCKKRYKLDENESITICSNCNGKNFTTPRKFNLMLNTVIGVSNENSQNIYLRPELAQGIFINFFNTYRSTRQKLPFGIGQIGFSYRNEITPRHYIFKTREFTQMELEYFFIPEETDREKLFLDFNKKIEDFLFNVFKIKKNNIQIEEVEKSKLAHYSRKTFDYLYNFSFGKGEIWGLSDRQDFDIRNHNQNSNEKFFVLNKNNIKVVPHVIESSVGLDRLVYSLLYEHYHEELVLNKERIILKLPFLLCPYKIAILPLADKHKNFAKEFYKKIKLENKFSCTYDDTGSIGKKYRRQDSIGTFFCLTIDDKTISQNIGKLRTRDTMEQVEININNISNILIHESQK